MGTRSVTIVFDDDKELCRIYRQFDGYPTGHGADLAEICNMQIVNGYNGDMKVGTHANGMGCLAAQIIQRLKAEAGLGGIYLQPPEGEISEWVEFVYLVRGKPGEIPTIECSTKTGPFPNIQADDGIVFAAMPANKVTPKFLEALR